MPNLNNIAEQAVKNLEKKTFGGVSKESAEKGIKSVKEAGERMITELTADVNGKSQVINNQNATINTLNQQLATSNASIQYHAQQLAEKEEALNTANSALDKTTAKLNRANKNLKNKTFVKENADGSQTIRKSNKNGAIMTIEKDSSGRVQSVEVKQLDGSVRTTKYNKESGIRETTTTNYNDKTIEYDLAGNTKAIRPGEEVKVIARTESVIGDGRTCITEKLSNGFTRQTFKPRNANDIAAVQLLNDQGKIVEQSLVGKNGSMDVTMHTVFGEGSSVKTVHCKSENFESELQTITKKDANGKEYLAEANFTDSNTNVARNSKIITNNWGIPERQVVTIKYPQNTTANKVNHDDVDFGFVESKIEYLLKDKGQEYMPAFRYKPVFNEATMVTGSGKNVVLGQNFYGDLTLKDNDMGYNKVADFLKDQKVRSVKCESSYVSPHNVGSMTPEDFTKYIPEQIR